MAIHRKAYRFRMRPTMAQRANLERHAHARRFVWNWALERWNEHYDATGKSISFGRLSAELTLLKRQPGMEWLNQVNGQSLQQALNDLARTFKGYFEKRIRRPRFKSRKKDKARFRIPQKIRIQDGRVFACRLGWIRIRYSQPVEEKIKYATFKMTPDGHWYVILTVEFEMPDVSIPAPDPDKTVGIDLGLVDFATFSDGSASIPIPRFYRRSQTKIRRANRVMCRRKKGSRRWEKARRRLAILHQKVADQRCDFLHKLSIDLVRRHDAVVVETLNLDGLARTKLAKSFSDSGMGEFRRQLSYKCEWHRKHFIAIDRWFPSSKMCHACGAIKDSLLLSERQWTCVCGVIHDRDLNAARNIYDEGLRQIGRGTPESDAREDRVRPTSVGDDR